MPLVSAVSLLPLPSIVAIFCCELLPVPRCLRARSSNTSPTREYSLTAAEPGEFCLFLWFPEPGAVPQDCPCRSPYHSHRCCPAAVSYRKINFCAAGGTAAAGAGQLPSPSEGSAVLVQQRLQTSALAIVLREKTDGLKQKEGHAPGLSPPVSAQRGVEVGRDTRTWPG